MPTTAAGTPDANRKARASGTPGDDGDGPEFQRDVDHAAGYGQRVFDL